MRRVYPGDEISAALLNELAEGRPSGNITGGGSLTVRQSAGGNAQVISNFTGAFVGVSSGTITARVGATLGVGDVELWLKDISTGDYVDSLILLQDCDNLSSTTGGIPTGTWVAGYFQDDGTPLIMTADCGN